MKYRATRKEILEDNWDVVRLGYCEIQNLLNGTIEPESYTCGVYGWNADIYRGTEGGQVLVTGYRPFGRDPKISYEQIRTYDRKAEKIKNDWGKPYEERRAALEELYKEFCERI